MNPVKIGLCAVAFSLVAVVAQEARAVPIGDPYGSLPGGQFNLVVKQGNNTLISGNYWLPSSGTHTYLTSIGESSVNLESFVDGTGDFRILHFQIKATDPNNYDHAGATSLFAPGGDPVTVSVSGIKFNGPTWVLPQVGGPTYLVSYMTNGLGHFYNLPESKPFNGQLGGAPLVQVPGPSYTDSNLNQYVFTTPGPSGAPSWEWGKILVPSATSNTIYSKDLTTALTDSTGFVRELGLSVAFTSDGTPEPTALCLLAAALPLLRRRGR